MDERAFLSELDAHRFLGWPVAAELPPREQLLSDARLIIVKNRELMRRQSKLGQAGLLVSPIWELDGSRLQARLAVLPEGFLGRYYRGEANEALDDDALLELIVDVAPLLFGDPVGAAFALGDVHRVWYDATAPTRAVVGHDGAHLRALSMILADAARKLAAGFDELEWMSSLGLPVAELVDDLDRPESAVSAEAKRKSEAMWAEEDAWLRAAFGAGERSCG